MIDWVVSPVDQTLPVAALEVSTTLSPAQNVVGPEAVIVGVAGVGFTVTVTGADSEVHPKIFNRLTVKVPETNTVIDCVPSPFGCQMLPKGALLVKITLSPSQNVSGPEAVMIGVGGVMFNRTSTTSEVSETQSP